MTEVCVAKTSEIEPGTGKLVTAEGKEVAIYNIDGSFHAISNICPHQGGPMIEGMVEGCTVVCPWHAWAFDVKTGSSPLNPRANIETYPVKVKGEEIFVTI